MGRHLVYTLALDLGGTTAHRNMAKLLVSSLLRTHFDGDIVVFHNSPHPLFMVPRAGVREVALHPLDAPSVHWGFVEIAQSCKHAVIEHLHPEGYDKVMFIDCDCVATRSINHLLDGNWDLAFFAETTAMIQNGAYGAYLTDQEFAEIERDGINSGTWAVAGSRCLELLHRWRAVDAMPPRVTPCLREQSAFNRVVLDWDGEVVEWPRREIALPFCDGNLQRYWDWEPAAIIHAAGAGTVNHKLPFLFSVFCMKFLYDPQLTLFNILEM